MENFNVDNILNPDEIEDLFAQDEVEDIQEIESDSLNIEESNEEIKEPTTEDLDTDELFSDDPESVGSEDKDQELEDTPSVKEGASPKNIYSSIASAFKEDGVLPDLDDSKIKDINDAESFSKAIEDVINSRLDEKSKRVNEALEYGIEPSKIKQYENAINYLDSITDEILSDEKEGIEVRKKLIYQDSLNRGYSKERALREVKKSFDAGSDIEDAKEARDSNKDYFKTSYTNEINEAKEEARKEELKEKEQAESLRKSLLDDKEVFEGVTLDKNVRQKIYNNISKPVFKTPEGDILTSIQKAEYDNPVEFRKKLGVIFTLTDGFKNLDNLVKPNVKKVVKSKVSQLENVINSTSRNGDGSLKLMTGVSDDPESSISGWLVDV